GFQLPTRDAVDALYEKLTAAGTPAQQPPFDAFWGARYAIVSDPDGNAVALMSPRDPAMGSETPLP
ncbi:MAG: VOC family protein, partial [Tepidiformaceae bacterium]